MDERKRGRPPIADVSVRVSVRLPASTYDRLDRIARAQQTSVPDVIRRISALTNQPRPQARHTDP